MNKENKCCTCTCKNVRINGSIIKQHVACNVKPIKNNLLRVCITSYTISTESVEVYDYARIRGILINKSYQCLKCLTCGTIFIFNTSKNESSMKKIVPMKDIQIQYYSKMTKENCLNASFQKNLNNHINDSLNDTNNCCAFCDDYIFDYMFSNKQIPFVGTFMQNENIFDDILDENNNYSELKEKK